MSKKVASIIKTFRRGELEERLRAAASEAGGTPLGDAEVRHLRQIVTSPSLIATSILDVLPFAELVDAQVHPATLKALTEQDPDDAVLHHALSVPDHVRVLGDKCLFESGVAGRPGPQGFDLDDVGRRAYAKASEVLELMAEDRRLRRYYEQNALDTMTIDEETEFLTLCAHEFSRHVELLQRVLNAEQPRPDTESPGTALVVRSGPTADDTQDTAESSTTSERRSPAAKSRGAALAPSRVLRDRGDGRDATDDDEADDDGPRRVADMHLVSRTDEEAQDERVRKLVAAEKTVLFSVLDTELLREELKKVVIYQDPAIDSLCDELCLYSTGTQDPRKPASYFLVGPTGVGKNYLAESLLMLFEKLWGIEVPYLELEGPEFTYPSDINELKGAARGFIRSDEEGIMTRFHARAHDKPFSVILVDEVEKAHPQLRRFFLPILDRGVMTDNRGTTLYFHNTMIFFTSNIGYSDASRSTKPIGFGDEEAEIRALGSFAESKIRKTLSPEFINRVHLLHFQHLTRDAVEQIFDLELAKIRRRYREAQGLNIEITEAAREELLQRGYNRDYGARNLSKVLNRHANIEISKLLKRDERRGFSDVTDVLGFLRDMREGRVPMDMDRAQESVDEVARIQVPYDRVTLDVEDGDFVYRRGQ